MKKGILINVNNETVTEVILKEDERGSSLLSMREHIGCDLVACVSLGENDIWVDDEGLLKINSDTKFFYIDDVGEPLCGNGLIMGYDSNTGRSVSTTLTIEQVKSKVRFLTLSEVRRFV